MNASRRKLISEYWEFIFPFRYFYSESWNFPQFAFEKSLTAACELFACTQTPEYNTTESNIDYIWITQRHKTRRLNPRNSCRKFHKMLGTNDLPHFISAYYMLYEVSLLLEEFLFNLRAKNLWTVLYSISKNTRAESALCRLHTASCECGPL